MRTSISLLTVAMLTVVLVAGCLSDDTAADASSGAFTEVLDNGYRLHCIEHDGPRFDPQTGRPADVCNVAVTAGSGPVNEPSIAANPTDPCNLIAGGNDYNLETDVWAGVYVSFDCGRTWDRDFLPGHPGDDEPTRFSQFSGAGDAAIAFADDGTAYYAGIAFNRGGTGSESRQTGDFGASGGTPASLIVARSDDGGRTWPGLFVPELGSGAYGSATTPVVVPGVDEAGTNDTRVGTGGAAYNEFEDKEWIAVAPDGTVYVSWTRFGGVYPWVSDLDDNAEEVDRPREEANIYLIRSDDRGENWTNEILVSRHNGNQGSVPAVAEDGTLHVVWMEFSEEERAELPRYPVNIVIRTSHDKGATFDDPVVIDTLGSLGPRGNEPHRFRTNGFPSITIDPPESPSAGRITVAWAGNRTGDFDVWMSQSMDEGATWTEPMRVNQDPVGNHAQQYIPWVTVGDDGVRSFVWYDGRHDPSLNTIAVWMAQTEDGRTFHELPVTDAPFSTDRDGFEGGNFLGDYLNVAASSQGVFAIWPDTRSGTDPVGNTDLYLAWLVPPVQEETP